jgi:hypothetical protein
MVEGTDGTPWTPGSTVWLELQPTSDAAMRATAAAADNGRRAFNTRITYLGDFDLSERSLSSEHAAESGRKGLA